MSDSPVTPTPPQAREEELEDAAGALWSALCEGDGQHSEALDKAIIMGHLRRFAASQEALTPLAQLEHLPQIQQAGEWWVPLKAVQALTAVPVGQEQK